MESHLQEKTKELIWALDFQKYTHADIGRIMNRHRSNIKRTVDKRPGTWKPKWRKFDE